MMRVTRQPDATKSTTLKGLQLSREVTQTATARLKRMPFVSQPVGNAQALRFVFPMYSRPMIALQSQQRSVRPFSSSPHAHTRVRDLVNIQPLPQLPPIPTKRSRLTRPCQRNRPLLTQTTPPVPFESKMYPGLGIRSLGSWLLRSCGPPLGPDVGLTRRWSWLPTRPQVRGKSVTRDGAYKQERTAMA
jgi:hypothetical protein